MEEAVFSTSEPPVRGEADGRKRLARQLVEVFPRPRQSFTAANSGCSRARAWHARTRQLRAKFARSGDDHKNVIGSRATVQTIFCSTAMRMSCMGVRALNFVRNDAHVVATVL